MSTDLDMLQRRLAAFYDDRDWTQFHTLKDVAASAAIEAAELQEIFLWRSGSDSDTVAESRRDDVESELADVLINCLNFARLAAIDPVVAVGRKLDELERRYPVAEVRGRVIAKSRARN